MYVVMMKLKLKKKKKKKFYSCKNNFKTQGNALLAI